MISVAIAGLTGQGIETAGEILSSSLNKLGYTHRAWRDFSTIIRGGHTLFELYISEKKRQPTTTDGKNRCCGRMGRRRGGALSEK